MSEAAECSDQRSVYLITYSRADLSKVETREDFAQIWLQAFGENSVQQWACCCEKHAEGDGVHFHLAIKFKKIRRWKKVKEDVIMEHGIVAHFQEFPTNYYDAYSYVTKEDADYITSKNHPMLANSPQTKKASAKRKSVRPTELRTREPAIKQPQTKLDVLTLYDIIITTFIMNANFSCLLMLREVKEKQTC